MAKRIIAVSINQCNVRALSFEDGKIVARSSSKGKGQYAFDELEKIIHDNIDTMFTADTDAIGLAVSAVINPFISQCITAEGTLKELENMDFAKKIQDKYDRKCVMLSEVHAALLGEMHYGVGRGYNTVAILNIEEGIGSAFYAFENVVYGENYVYGDMAHKQMVLDGRRCTCGKYGCYEMYIGGVGLDMYASEFGLDTTNRAQIFEKYQNQDPKAIDVVNAYYLSLLHGLKVIKKNLTADAYIISGGLNNCLEKIMPKIREGMPKENILLSVLGSDAAVYGAYEWAKKIK